MTLFWQAQELNDLLFCKSQMYDNQTTIHYKGIHIKASHVYYKQLHFFNKNLTKRWQLSDQKLAVWVADKITYYISLLYFIFIVLT